MEGAVAVSKTTLLPKLHSVIASHNIDIDLVLEPVDKWVQWAGKHKSWNLLDMMYKDPKKFAATYIPNSGGHLQNSIASGRHKTKPVS